MANVDIGDLVSLLESGTIDNNQLISTISKIQFKPAAFSFEDPKPETTAHFIPEPFECQKSVSSIQASPIQRVVERGVYDSASKKNLKSKEVSDESQAPYVSLSARTTPNTIKLNNFLNRMADYQKISEARKVKAKKLIQDESEKEYSFQPRVNTNLTTSTENAGERLYNQGRVRQIQEEMAAEEQRRKEETKDSCTFYPSINPTSAKPRYMQAPKIFSLRSMSLQDNLSEDDTMCTFRPKVNEYTSKRNHTRDYLRADPFVRLSQCNNMVKEYESKGRVQLQSPELKERLASFQNRQYEYERKREEKKLKLLGEVQASFSPKINNKKKLFTSLDQSGASIEKKELKKHFDDKELEYTFHPLILPISRMLRCKNPERMCYEPAVAKEEKVKDAKTKMRLKETKDCTFNPKTNKNKYVAIKSKLQLECNPKEYIERINEEMKKKQNCARVFKRANEHQEIQQCTYKPQIIGVPHYIAKGNPKAFKEDKKYAKRYSYAKNAK
eukprot:TRINITY_DN7341_c0_g1_i4.p1 TRINITY_DN7341_c0_g1~~TRINITY_DN7341_c0_g1_i4.p1  ORF type:complete len:500 (-),score=115.23 TRINITY_DN7341_c0_g1_i4:61-1560(-)